MFSQTAVYTRNCSGFCVVRLRYTQDDKAELLTRIRDYRDRFGIWPTSWCACGSDCRIKLALTFQRVQPPQVSCCSFSCFFLSNNLLIAIRGSRALAQSFAGKAPVKNRCWGGEYQEGRVKEPVLSQQMVTNTLRVILPHYPSRDGFACWDTIWLWWAQWTCPVFSSSFKGSACKAGDHPDAW